MKLSRDATKRLAQRFAVTGVDIVLDTSLGSTDRLTFVESSIDKTALP